MTRPAPHTDRVARLLRNGNVEKAKTLHNKRVLAEFDRAKTGEGPIDLSDLVAAKEEITLRTTL